MATIKEIREDFFYLYAVELALMLVLIFRYVYFEEYLLTFQYFLIFVGIYILQLQLYRGFEIHKAHTLREKLILLDTMKSKGKAALTLSLIILILSSSWGIVSFLSGYWEETILYSALLTYTLPWYIAIYVGWLVYLTLLKGKYKKIIVEYLRKKTMEGKIKQVMLIHNSGNILAVVSRDSLGNGEKKILKEELMKRSQDFRWRNNRVALESYKNMKLGVVYTGNLSQSVRARIKHVLRTVQVTHPQVIKEGKANAWEQVEIEKIIKRNLF